MLVIVSYTIKKILSIAILFGFGMLIYNLIHKNEKK